MTTLPPQRSRRCWKCQELCLEESVTIVVLGEKQTYCYKCKAGVAHMNQANKLHKEKWLKKKRAKSKEGDGTNKKKSTNKKFQSPRYKKKKNNKSVKHPLKKCEGCEVDFRPPFPKAKLCHSCFGRLKALRKELEPPTDHSVSMPQGEPSNRS